MALSFWENSNKWITIKSAFNNLITLLKGGYLGQVFTSNGNGNDPSWQDIEDVVLPNQTLNAGKFLSTDGDSASWESIPSYLDRQIDRGTPATVVPSSAPGETVISTITTAAADGFTRDYMIIATAEFSRITTSPETEWRIKKDGVTLVSYKSVAIPTDGQTQTQTFPWLEKDVDGGVDFEFVVYSPSNQVTLNEYTFIIDGNK